MKNTGKIVKYNTGESFGEIETEHNQLVVFEKFECDYEYIRLGDKVRFDLVKSFDGKYDAINVEFISNPVLSELDKSYQKQTAINCNVKRETEFGYLLEYKGCLLYLPNKNGSIISIDDNIEVYLSYFSYGHNIIVSTNKKQTKVSTDKYRVYSNKCDSFQFNILEKNNYGVLVTDDDDLVGFIPNSHIIKGEKEMINIGEEVNACVISASINKGLILSQRNNKLSNVLDELQQGYIDKTIFTGRVSEIRFEYYVVSYNQVDLYLNKSFLGDSVLELDECIEFNILKFNRSKEISISTTDFFTSKLYQVYKGENRLYCKVKRIVDNGCIVDLFDKYEGYISFSELSDQFGIDYSVLRIGSVVKASVIGLDYKRLHLSRLKFIKKLKMTQSIRDFEIGQNVDVKIIDKLSYFGLKVSFNNVIGEVPISTIIPVDSLTDFAKNEFVKYCRVVFKKRSNLQCIISSIDTENNLIEFEMDKSHPDNQLKINMIVGFFESNIEHKEIVESFFNVPITC